MALARVSDEAWEERVRSIPAPWNRGTRPGVDTGSTLGAGAEVRAALRRASILPIWSVKGENGLRQFKKPVAVTLSQEGEFHFAANEELNLVGTGFTPNEAVQDFLEHVQHFEEEYRSLSWDQVTGDAIRLKTLFESLFVA